MRVPAGTRAKVFKCVKCGALVQTGRGTPPPVKSSVLSSPQEKPAAKPMADLFIDMGLVSREQIEEARTKREPEEKLFETLLRLEMLTKENLHDRMSKEGHAAINLAHFTIDRELTELVPLDIVRKQWVLPISSLGKSLTVAMVCPVDMEATGGMRIRAMLCKMDEFLGAVRKHYRMPESQDVVEEESGVAPPQGAAAGALSPASYPGDEAIREALAELERLPVPNRVMNQVDAVVGEDSEGLRQVVSVVGN